MLPPLALRVADCPAQIEEEEDDIIMVGPGIVLTETCVTEEHVPSNAVSV